MKSQERLIIFKSSKSLRGKMVKKDLIMGTICSLNLWKTKEWIMSESYIQYAGGYQKDNVDKIDIIQAVKDIQEMDDEHGAFWVSVFTDDENVIEVNKNLSLSIIFQGEETQYQATDWKEVEKLSYLLLQEKFEKIKKIINKERILAIKHRVNSDIGEDGFTK